MAKTSDNHHGYDNSKKAARNRIVARVMAAVMIGVMLLAVVVALIER